MDMIDLSGVRMRTVSADSGGALSGDTIFVFEHRGSVVSARYRGGKIVDGYLIGHVSGDRLNFRYVQADTDNNLDAGSSEGVLTKTHEGKWRLTEHFTWATKAGSGVNVFQEIESRAG